MMLGKFGKTAKFTIQLVLLLSLMRIKIKQKKKKKIQGTTYHNFALELEAIAEDKIIKANFSRETEAQKKRKEESPPVVPHGNSVNQVMPEMAKEEELGQLCEKLGQLSEEQQTTVAEIVGLKTEVIISFTRNTSILSLLL